MGNKVIKIQNPVQETAEKSQNLEVYRDISMVSERNASQLPDDRGKQKFYMAKDVNVRAVFNSLRNIFTWIQGERVLLPDFGSRLRYYLYEGITPENKEQIAAEIKGVCLKWEPRVNIVRVTPVDSVDDAEDNTVQIDMIFTIPSLSDEQYKYSYVYNRTR